MQRPPELEEMVTMDATQLPQFHPPRRAPQRLHQKAKGEKSDESKLATTPASRRRGRSGRVAPEEMGEGKQGVRCGRIWASGACQPPASGAASRAWPGKAVAAELRIWKATTRGVRACHAPCGDGGTRAREHGCWSARSKIASARGGGGTGPCVVGGGAAGGGWRRRQRLVVEGRGAELGFGVGVGIAHYIP